jgi:hypothetical protein
MKILMLIGLGLLLLKKLGYRTANIYMTDCIFSWCTSRFMRCKACMARPWQFVLAAGFLYTLSLFFFREHRYTIDASARNSLPLLEILKF